MRHTVSAHETVWEGKQEEFEEEVRSGQVRRLGLKEMTL